MDSLTIIAAFSLVIVGKFADLDALATLIAARVPDLLHIAMTEYPVGWRCQVEGSGDQYQQVADLVLHQIGIGVPVQIANEEPMPTRIYAAEDAIQKGESQ